MQKGLSVLMVCLCLSPSYAIQATEKPTLRHVGGFQGIEARGGMAVKGFCGGVDYSYYLHRTGYFKCGLGGEIEEDEDERTSFFSVFTQPALAYGLGEVHDQLYLNILLGTIIAYEGLTKSGQNQHQDSLNIGIIAGLEVEFFMMQHTALLLSLLPRWLFLGDHQDAFDLALEVGIKITF